MADHPNYTKHINLPNYNPETGVVLDDKGYSSVCDRERGITCRMKIGFKRDNMELDFYKPTYSCVHNVVYCCIKHRESDKEYWGTSIFDFGGKKDQVEARRLALISAYSKYLDYSVVSTKEQKGMVYADK